MLGAIPELGSKDFPTWEAAIRPRLELSFAATYRITNQQAREVVDEAIGRAGEFWDVVSQHHKPSLWAYKAAMKLADERFGPAEW